VIRVVSDIQPPGENGKKAPDDNIVGTLELVQALHALQRQDDGEVVESCCHRSTPVGLTHFALVSVPRSLRRRCSRSDSGVSRTVGR
jgi:hypothetical protein